MPQAPNDRAPKVFIANTDKKSLHLDPASIWIDNNIVATGGSLSYGNKLQVIYPGDYILMYSNKVGVVGVGIAQEFWDTKSHNTGQLIYTAKNNITGHSDPEYRVSVNWIVDLRSKPIDSEHLKNFHIAIVPSPFYAPQAQEEAINLAQALIKLWGQSLK